MKKNASKTQCHSVVKVAKKLRDFRGIISNLFLFYNNRICLHWCFFLWFHQSLLVIAIPGKRWKHPFLKDKICKKELHFKEKQTRAIGWFFIILFSLPLSLKMCLVCVIQKVTHSFKKSPSLRPKISRNFEKYLRGGRMTQTKLFSDYRLSYQCNNILSLNNYNKKLIATWLVN